jgi:hypothetical protein
MSQQISIDSLDVLLSSATERKDAPTRHLQMRLFRPLTSHDVVTARRDDLLADEERLIPLPHRSHDRNIGIGELH